MYIAADSAIPGVQLVLHLLGDYLYKSSRHAYLLWAAAASACFGKLHHHASMQQQNEYVHSLLSRLPAATNMNFEVAVGQQAAASISAVTNVISILYGMHLYLVNSNPLLELSCMSTRTQSAGTLLLYLPAFSPLHSQAWTPRWMPMYPGLYGTALYTVCNGHCRSFCCQLRCSG